MNFTKHCDVEIRMLHFSQVNIGVMQEFDKIGFKGYPYEGFLLIHKDSYYEFSLNLNCLYWNPKEL